MGVVAAAVAAVFTLALALVLVLVLVLVLILALVFEPAATVLLGTVPLVPTPPPSAAVVAADGVLLLLVVVGFTGRGDCFDFDFPIFAVDGILIDNVFDAPADGGAVTGAVDSGAVAVAVVPDDVDFGVDDDVDDDVDGGITADEDLGVPCLGFWIRMIGDLLVFLVAGADVDAGAGADASAEPVANDEEDGRRMDNLG